MADDYKKSGQSFHGVKKDQYEQEIHMQDQLNIADVLIKRQQELNEEKKKGTIPPLSNRLKTPRTDVEN